MSAAKAAALAFLLIAAPASAQHEHHPAAPETGWAWSVESNVFLTGNLQVRRFTDFYQFESQNWLMGMASHKAGTASLTLHGMLSFEPLTLRDLGSSQAFQTGETFAGAPLIDYQHPHDLVMGLSAAYQRPAGRTTLLLRGGLVDEPALGPTAFMHRASANLHPTAPLSHHQLDSTHITHGVLTAGVRAGVWQVEASVFQGREPDENRLDVDLGAFDSYAGRVSWLGGGTRAQLSAGRLESPHASEPGDMTRITASIEHNGRLAGRTAALTVAFGQNREQFATEGAFLAELALAVSRLGTAYLRGEIVDKHILEAGGQHPVGVQHPHIISTVWALTGGYQHDVWRSTDHALVLGADLTGHVVPRELREPYGRPVSTHLYARWSCGVAGAGGSASGGARLRRNSAELRRQPR